MNELLDFLASAIALKTKVGQKSIRDVMERLALLVKKVLCCPTGLIFPAVKAAEDAVRLVISGQRVSAAATEGAFGAQVQDLIAEAKRLKDRVARIAHEREEVREAIESSLGPVEVGVSLAEAIVIHGGVIADRLAKAEVESKGGGKKKS